MDNRHVRSVITLLSLCGWLLASAGLAGCSLLQPAPASPNPVNPAPAQNPDVLRIGDTVKVDRTGGPEPLAPIEEAIKDDGTISLPLIGPVTAAGKTAGAIQREIQSAYVPRYYLRLTVTVRTSERFYYVGGEVKQPGRQAYAGSVTVLKAIQSAGDFTDFANKRAVRLTRVNGEIQIIDCTKARREPRLDLPVYPGDRIDVEKSIL